MDIELRGIQKQRQRQDRQEKIQENEQIAQLKEQVDCFFSFEKKKKGTGESAQRTDGGRAGAVRHGGVGTQFRGVESPPGDPLRSLR